jgi:hypothetical protein
VDKSFGSESERGILKKRFYKYIYNMPKIKKIITSLLLVALVTSTFGLVPTRTASANADSTNTTRIAELVRIVELLRQILASLGLINRADLNSSTSLDSLNQLTSSVPVATLDKPLSEYSSINQLIRELETVRGAGILIEALKAYQNLGGTVQTLASEFSTLRGFLTAVYQVGNLDDLQEVMKAGNQLGGYSQLAGGTSSATSIKQILDAAQQFSGGNMRDPLHYLANTLLYFVMSQLSPQNILDNAYISPFREPTGIMDAILNNEDAADPLAPLFYLPTRPVQPSSEYVAPEGDTTIGIIDPGRINDDLMVAWYLDRRSQDGQGDRRGPAQELLPRGKEATIIDIETKLRFNIKRTGGRNHADVEPLTAQDAAIQRQIYSRESSPWNRRAVIVVVDGKPMAASINGKGHGYQQITDNNFSGHFCIHFLNSRLHASGGSVDLRHQAMVRKAATADVSSL